MGMTMSEKILAAHSGRQRVSAGEYLNVAVDFIVANETTGSLAISRFEALGCDRVFDRDCISIITDHTVPANTVESAQVCKVCMDFSRKYVLTHTYDVGRLGIAHVMVPDLGLVGAGDVVVGADSHTTTYGALGAFATGMGSTDILYAMLFGEIWMKVPATVKLVFHGRPRGGVVGKDLILRALGRLGLEGANYKAVEFAGEALRELSMDSRFTMANMSMEAGAKAGLFAPDDRTIAYMRGRCIRPFTVCEPDPDAVYEQVVDLDVTDLEPQVALPHSPANAVPVSEAESLEVRLDQVFIGSCTNGRLEDLRIASEILAGRSVRLGTRLIVIPGSQQVYLEGMRLGYVQAMVEAGAAFCTPSCGPCVGRHMGLLAQGETCLSTTNRNFAGRMGHKDSLVYLSGPAVAAASAVAGRIVSPESI